MLNQVVHDISRGLVYVVSQITGERRHGQVTHVGVAISLWTIMYDHLLEQCRAGRVSRLRIVGPEDISIHLGRVGGVKPPLRNLLV